MSQMLTIVKDYLKDKKWVIILLGGMVGLFGFMIVSMLAELDLELGFSLYCFEEEEVEQKH